MSELLRITKALGNPLAVAITATHFIAYREQRLLDGISGNHLNHELTYLKSVFNELARVKEWNQANPFANIKKIKIDERELSFLSFVELERLLYELEHSKSKVALIISKICLSIGTRWGEAAKLRGEQIYAGKIHLTATKNGRNRSIPISKELEAEIFSGRPRRGRLFNTVSYTGFSRALERAKIELPMGQLTHVLRHTFASHFMMSGGNLLDLNKILGHTTIQMTMRYAHLSPEHLSEAVRRNPLKQIEVKREEKVINIVCNACGHNVDTFEELLLKYGT